MIDIRRSVERNYVQQDNCEIWRTIFPKDISNPFTDSFGVLTVFNEIRLSPGGGTLPEICDEAEVVTYVCKGALAYNNSNRSSGVIHTGEFQYITTGKKNRRKEKNASQTDSMHIFRLLLHPSQVGLDPAHEQKRFTAAQRRNLLCVIASEDGRKGSLRIHQDALIHSGILDPGYHLIHELLPGRSAWLHVIYGEVKLDDIIMITGDGAGFTKEPLVSLTANENTEILLVDLGQTLISKLNFLEPTEKK